MELKDKVTAVKGVGPKMEEKLGRLGIHTVEDLISYFPRKYQIITLRHLQVRFHHVRKRYVLHVIFSDM